MKEVRHTHFNIYHLPAWPGPRNLTGTTKEWRKDRHIDMCREKPGPVGCAHSDGAAPMTVTTQGLSPLTCKAHGVEFIVNADVCRWAVSGRKYPGRGNCSSSFLAHSGAYSFKNTWIYVTNICSQTLGRLCDFHAYVTWKKQITSSVFSDALAHISNTHSIRIPYFL